MKITPTGKLLTSMLGAFNGAVYSAVMLPMIWAGMALANRDNALATTPHGEHLQLITNVRWSSVVIAWLVAFTLASLFVGSIWNTNRKRSILFWEIVGVLAVAAWNGFGLIGSLLGRYYEGDTMSYAWVTSLRNPLFGPISFGAVILVNFVYGNVLRAFLPKDA